MSLFYAAGRPGMPAWAAAETLQRRLDMKISNTDVDFRNFFRMVTKILKPAWGLNAVCGPCFLSLPARFRGLQLCAWMECHWRFCRAVSYNWLPWSAKEEIKRGQEARYLRELAIVLPQTYFLRFGGRCCQNPAKYNLSDELWNSDEASGRVGRGRRKASFHVLAKQCCAEPETVTNLVNPIKY